MHSDEILIWWIKSVAYAAFASFGGIAGHLLRTIDSNQKISWWRASIEGVAAGFVGLLVLFTCQAMNLSEAWTGVIVGVGGWLGAGTTIKMLETLIRKKLGIEGTPPNAAP